ncbi:MAG: hypothetical protein U0531_20520 [Dehalococcoidia bacterium]
MRRLRSFDWDAVAGISAAVLALVLHILHIVDEQVVLAVILVILALVLIRDLRREDRDERVAEAVGRAEAALHALQGSLAAPDTVLIGPRRLRVESERFARNARGEMVWFNVCLTMFAPQALFDVLLRPAVENPRVTSIIFMLDNNERERWQTLVLPKLAACAGREGARAALVRLHETISFILSEQESHEAPTEAHLSFWGEPFMARTAGRHVPRYIFHVQRHSELIARLAEIQRLYRLGDG